MTYLADLAAQALVAEKATAKAEEEAAMAGLVAAARTVVAGVLDPDLGAPDALHVEAVVLADRLVVLSDAVTCLGVTHADAGDAEVWLVADEDGDQKTWTRLVPLACLPDLARALAAQKESLA